jgi:hypothetical protein
MMLAQPPFTFLMYTASRLCASRTYVTHFLIANHECLLGKSNIVGLAELRVCDLGTRHYTMQRPKHARNVRHDPGEL